MAIGNPISLTSNVATKTISVIATASQSIFTVAGGYRINELAVFRNGVRLVDGRDFTARDGSIVTLLSAASEGDALEFQVFDTFRVADAITPFDSAQTIEGDLSIVGVLSATQLGSVNFNVTSGIQTFHDVRVGGALTVAGALTFDDVTNVDSVGYATFRSGINVQGAGSTTTTLSVSGVSTFTGAINGNVTGNISGGTVSGTTGTFSDVVEIGGDANNGTAEGIELNTSGFLQLSRGSGVSALLAGYTQGSSTQTVRINNDGTATFKGDLTIADKIIHDGDTNTAIRFPAADTFTVETAGSEALRVDSSGNTGVNCTSGGGKLAILANSSSYEGLELQTPNGDGSGEFHIGVHQNGSTAGRTIVFKRGGADGMDTESLRIDSSGRTLIGNTQDSAPFSWGLGLQVSGTSTNAGLSIRRDQNSSGGALLMFVKSRGSLNGNTVVQDGDQIGGMYFNAADGTDVNSYAAQIAAEIDGTPGSNDVPGRLVFKTTADGASSPTERLRLASDNTTHVGERDGNQNSVTFGKGIFNIVGPDPIDTSFTASGVYLQVGGTESELNGLYPIGFGFRSSASTHVPAYIAYKTTNSGAAEKGELLFATRDVTTDTEPSVRMTIGVGGTITIGDPTYGGDLGQLRIINDASSTPASLALFGYGNTTDGDAFGQIQFAEQEGGSGGNIKAKIEAQAVSTNERGSDLVFFTAANSASSVATERLRITSAGNVGVNDSDPSSLLSISQTNGNAKLQIKRANSASNTDDYGSILWRSAGGTAVGSINVARETGEDNGYMFFQTTSGGTMAERLRIDSNGNFIFKNGALIENGFYDSGGGLTGNYNHDLATYGNVHYSGSNAAGAFTYNLRINSSVSLNSVMAAGDTISFTLMHESNNTSYYMTAFKIDGTTQSVKYAGGSAPSAATGSGIDVYSFSIVKLSDATFKVFGTFTNHA